jgi:hypothetical protein
MLSPHVAIVLARMRELAHRCVTGQPFALLTLS